MILKMYAIYDMATEMFGRPFFMVADGQATRSFRDEISREDPNNDLSKHPDDFALYRLGEFNDNTGRSDILADPMLLIRGKDVSAILGTKGE